MHVPQAVNSVLIWHSKFDWFHWHLACLPSIKGTGGTVTIIRQFGFRSLG
jgi:hypothetical protein